MLRRPIAALAAAAIVVAVPATRASAQQDTARKDGKPLTVKQVAKNVHDESKRVYKRSEKAVRKGAHDTAKQAKREERHIARTVSPEEKRKQEAEKARSHNP